MEEEILLYFSLKIWWGDFDLILKALGGKRKDR